MFCVGHMIVASAGFGHCTDLPGFVDRQTLPRCDDVVALSPQSLWAIAGRGRIFQQRIHPMPRQLPQSQQNRKYRRGSQDAILAGCQPRRMARLAFPPAGPGNGQAFPGGRGRQRRKQPQRRQRRSESRLSQWQAGQRSMGKARDPIRGQREQLRHPATVSEDLPNSHAGGQFCSSPSRSGVEFGAALGEKPLWN